MVEVIKSRKLAYVPVRKVGNTSVRKALRALAAGPDDYLSTKDVPMSPYIRWRASGCYKFTVVRDPVRRFLSAYGNRVRHYPDLHKHPWHRWPLQTLGLSLDPDIDDFCRHFRAYYALNDKIRRHFRPQWRYLGRDLGWYDKIYRIENLDELAADLSELAGRKIRVPRLQTGGPKLSFDDLDAASQRLILNFTRADYALLADYYEPPA